MLANYLTLALRNLQKKISFTIINVLGLCLGMTAFILIAEYVTYEKSYNNFHTNLPGIYRILNHTEKGGYEPYTPPGFAALATQQLQGIEEYCRVADGSGIGAGVVSFDDPKIKDKSFRETSFAYADGNFFKVFSFEILKGDGAALKKPNVVAISESASVKYFGKENPLGKVIILNNQFGKIPYTVEAVFHDMPENSDIQFNVVFSLETLANKANLGGNEDWAKLDGISSQWLFTFVQLNKNVTASTIADQFTAMVKKILPEEKINVELQPLNSMHLGRSMSESFPTFGSLRFNYLLSGIAILIIVIAWFNYVNLSTASALGRAKEVGIRKVVGASKAQLIRQFLGESLLLNLFSLLLSVGLVNILQIPFNDLIEKKLSLDSLNEMDFWFAATGFLIIGTLASGAYTAFILSSFNPSQVLKGVFSKSIKGVLVRKSLVVVQFSISTLLISATIILYQQWQFMKHKDLGLNPDQIVVIKGAEVNRDETFKDRTTGFQNNIRSASFVQGFSRSGNVPTDGFNFSTEGFTRLNPSPENEKTSYEVLMIDYQYLDTYQIKLAAGSNFTPEMCEKDWNAIEYVMINERAAKSLGFTSPENAVGQKIKNDSRELIVRGVIKDYHHMSVQNAIGSVIYVPRNNGSYYSVKLSGKNYPDMIKQLQDFYLKSFPGNPFEYQFLDQSFAAKYQIEKQYSLIFTTSSCLAILIACLGLFGLATYSVEQRTKEIGIRKVLGSNARQIVSLLSKDFIVLVCIAFVIAAPVSWWMMNKWLQSFAYRIDIAWWVYLIAGATTMAIALATVGTRAFKGAATNPVNSLRNE
ncbi:MAG: ABC transporter permease [Chryseolinea sp.]